MLTCVLAAGCTRVNAKPLHEAIREAYTGLGFTQAQLAERMGVDQTTISRLANGRWGEAGGPTPDLLAKIEEAAGRPRGWILVQAGYVQAPGSLREAIELDPGLSKKAREMLLTLHDAVAE